MPKIKVAILYGGKSAEHDVSVNSAKTIYSLIDKKKYSVFTIYITRQGLWFIQKLGVTKETHLPAAVSMGGKYNLISQDGKKFRQKIDVFIPMLHGPYGEDGTVQGMFEMLNTAYVGCDVLSSSIGMDKIICKQLVKNLKIPVLKHVVIENEKNINYKNVLGKVKKLGLPVFVKPNSMGSSVGITKVIKQQHLKSAIAKAFKYDSQIYIEKAVDNAREIVCAVLGSKLSAKASVCGEIVVLTRQFYDYESKYVDATSHKLVMPAKISKKLSDQIRKTSVEIFKTLKCSGLARIDFFIKKGTDRFYFCEINTIPGFTEHSLYPNLWKKTGTAPRKLVEELINTALKEHSLKQKTSLSL